MADPRDFGENDNSAAPLAGGTDASTDRDLGLGYGGSDDPNRRAGPLYDPGPEPGLGFGGSDDRGPGAMRDPAGESAGTAQALEGTEMGSPSDNIRSSRVKGTDVYNREGEHLGHIDDVVLSKREGRVVYAIMSFGGFLGIGERYHPLPWDKLDYDPSRGGYVVSISRAQLEGAPSYPPGEEPDWNDPSYGNELTRYYVPPLL